MNEDRLHALLVCIARALQAEHRQQALHAGLLPVQWAILTYLRDANRYSNTPQALGDYLALTKGTVSQSLKLLGRNGWITRKPDPDDRRMVRLMLSEAGLGKLDGAEDPEWRAATRRLPKARRTAAEAALARLLGEWQQARHGRSFGVCHSCRHFCQGADEHRCGLTGEPLSTADSALICREHEEPLK